MNAILAVLCLAVIRAIPLLLGTTGEILHEKSGSLNLGVEGTMAVGAIGGFLCATASNSLFVGLLGGFLCGAIMGLIFSVLTVTFKANQNVTGLAITIFGVGLCTMIGESLKNQKKFPFVSDALAAQIAENGIPGLRNIPFLGELLFGYNAIVYIGLAIAICAWIYLYRSKAGLRTRAVGDHPGAADSMGVSIDRYRYVNSMIGAGIMGIGGVFMALIINLGSWNENWINGYGWISIALVIFANWSPARAIGGSFVFGLLLALQSTASGLASAFPTVFGWMSKIPVEFYQMLPFLMTAVIIVIGSIRKKRNLHAPMAVGLNYFREDR